MTDLPAGRYTVTASKSGYVTVQYGQARPFESGKAIELAEKQVLDGIDIGMPRGGAISGRIVDEFGEPLPDAGVTIMRVSWSNGKRRLTGIDGRGYPTDDLGHYRMYGLPPGEYYVTATKADFEMFADLPMMGFSPFAAASSAAGAGPSSGYATTYFPGTPNAAEAQRVTVTAGQEVANVDFPLAAVRLARVSGFVLNSEGKPVGGTAVSLSPVSREGLSPDVSNVTFVPTVARTAQDGSFVIRNVAPGDFVLRADAMQVMTSTQGDNTMVFRATRLGGDAGGEQESGMVPVSVAGEDISNVTVVTSKGGRATGRVIMDGEPKPSMTGIRVTAQAADTETSGLGFPASAVFAGAAVKEDGSFELKGQFGTRLIRATAPPGWTLRSVKLNGTDITDTGAEFKTGETYTLEVELTRRTTSIMGGVSASDGSLVKDYTAVIFAENPDLWRLSRTRWVTGTRPDQDGRFKIANMPAGNYLAVALDYVPNGEWGDPEILDRLKSRAKRFTLDDGGSQTLDLKITDKY